MAERTYTLTELITNLREAGKRLAASDAPHDFQTAEEAIGWAVASMLGFDIDSDPDTAEASIQEFDALLTAAGL